MSARRRRWHAATGLVLGALLTACGEPSSSLTVTELPVPSADSVAVPQLTMNREGRLIASWLAPQRGGGYAFRFAVRDSDGWGAVKTIVADDSVFMHPTDLPSVTQLSTGDLAAVWQRKVNKATSGDAWQYEFRVQFSQDGGERWSAPVSPHPGSTLGGEHEFHSAWATPDGTLGLAWIDPRDQTVVAPASAGAEAQFLGAMQLISSEVTSQGEVREETVIDEVICECCPTSVAVAAGRPLLAYRDKRVPPNVPRDSLRYEMTVLRDFSLARLEPATADSPAHWVSGERITEDNWLYSGCPNNGAALAARGDTVALAWWTAEGDRPRVQVRWSNSGGRSFGAPLAISEGRPDGQVAVAISATGTFVAWLQEGDVRARFVDRAGKPGPIVTVGKAGGRHRLPTMQSTPDGGAILGFVGSGARFELRLLRSTN